jgi:hypothetical protein
MVALITQRESVVRSYPRLYLQSALRVVIILPYNAARHLSVITNVEILALKRLASSCWGEISDHAEESPSLHIFRSHRATDVGSNRTQVPIRNDGILPAFACLKIVIFDTFSVLDSSSAVRARPIRSIRSGSDIGSAGLFWGLHGCIYLLC